MTYSCGGFDEWARQSPGGNAQLVVIAVVDRVQLLNPIRCDSISPARNSIHYDRYVLAQLTACPHKVLCPIRNAQALWRFEAQSIESGVWGRLGSELECHPRDVHLGYALRDGHKERSLWIVANNQHVIFHMRRKPIPVPLLHSLESNRPQQSAPLARDAQVRYPEDVEQA